MPDLLTAHAQAQPDKPAVIDDRPDGTIIEWTYAELEATANRLGRVLLDFGLKPGDKAVWCGQNSPWVVAMGHACRKIGVVSVPLNYRLTPEEAAYVTDNCDATVVFADAEYADMFSEIRKDIPQVNHVLIYDGSPNAGQEDATGLIERSSPDAIDLGQDFGTGSAMIYTSGTTGKPKGAYRRSAGDPEQMMKNIAVYEYTPDDVYFTTGPLYHSGPGGFMAIAFVLGQTVVVQRKFDPEDWLRLVDRYGITSTFAAPTPIRRICNLDRSVFDKYDVSSIRVMVANAAPWPYALKKAYLERFPAHSLFEVYGSTELGVNTILRPEHQLSKPGSCGTPAPGVEIRLYDDQGNQVTQPRQTGELFVRSASVFSTYHKAQEKFDADHRDGFQTVGDIAYFDEEGFYYICDRKKDMIISGGVNIYPAEIESALEEHPEIVEAAVFGIPNEEWGEAVHAVVVRVSGSSLTPDRINAHAKEHLASYKIPRSYDFVDELPKTGSGKILKKDLRAPYWKDHQTGVL